MKNLKKYKQLIYITYDGLNNSVFASLVLKPLLKRLNDDNNLEIMLVSFEKTKPNTELLKKIIPAHDRLHFVLCKKNSFWGKSSLWLAIYQLKKLLKIYPPNKIITRGPLAGWVAIKALAKDLATVPLSIQARGLCAEEYRFVTQNLKEFFIKKIFRKIIYKRLKTIEKQSYSKENVTIEAVSPALKKYLAASFAANESRTDIAKLDLPEGLDKETIKILRARTRKELYIPEEKFIYCYSGSCKPWQCIPEIINFFKTKYTKDKKSFLLILSSDKKEIEKSLNISKLPKDSYLLLSVKPNNLHKYLAACDVGLLFREKDIINWVSRPTKMLEYQSVGLKIEHNNTIAWLANQSQN